jgi:hypothetical protein
MERHQTPARPQAPGLAAAQRRIAVRLIVQSLQGWRHGDPCLGHLAASLDRRRSLQRQPWRRSPRPSGAPVSVLEEIRRFEARERAH